MFKYALPVCFIVILVILAENVFCAQLLLDFSQDNRTYLWNAKLNYDHRVDQGLFWGFSSAINSMLIKKSVFSNNQNRWQDDGNYDLDLGYSLTRNLKMGVLFSQDVNSLEKRRVISSEYGITTDYQIHGVRFVQVIGGKDIQRRWEEGKRDDRGFNHRLEISHSSYFIPQSSTRLSFSQVSSKLSNVPLLERDFSLFFAKNFLASDSLEFSYQEDWSKKNFYQGDFPTAKINTQRRTQRLVNLRTSTRFPLQVRVNFDFDFLSNGYKYSGDKEMQLPGLTDNSSSSQNFTIKAQRDFSDRFTLSSYYKYLRTEDDYVEDFKDMEMRSAEWGGNVMAKISRSDSLYFTASIGVTSFYASSLSDQLNDRDMLTFSAWGEYRHVFNSLFSMQVEGGFRNFHQVYISSRLSANNNHNQTYVLSPTLSWRPFFSLLIKQNYNIQANYIYYDYEKSKESTNNRLFRRASSNTNLTYAVTPRIDLVLGYTYRYEDYGQLIWKDQWVQKPSWEQRTHTVGFSMAYRPAANISFSPEYSYQKRKSWNHFTDLVTLKKVRSLSDRYSQNTISVACRYFVSDQDYIRLSAARRVQKSTQSYKEISDYATVSINRTF